MESKRNQSRLQPAQAERIGQATRKDGEVVELNIEELEERIAPAYRPPGN